MTASRYLVTSVALLTCILARPAWPQMQPPGQDAAGPGREPPQNAYDDCRGKKEGDAVRHLTREGEVAATCVSTPRGLAARPDQPPRPGGQGSQSMQRQNDSGSQSGQARDGQGTLGGQGASAGQGRPQGRLQDGQGQLPGQGPQDPGRREGPPAGVQARTGQDRYSLDQAVSDKAQLATIAFDGLAFLTGDFALDTFLPPGKVCDYFGFQHMRDIDAAGAGHSTSFLTRIAHNMLTILDDTQRARLVELANRQQEDIRRFALMRLPLIAAFRRNLAGNIPAGSSGLSKQAVMEYSSKVYELDGELAFGRATVMAEVLRSLSDRQKLAVARLKFGDSRSWPEVPEPPGKRGLSHEADVAVMTYASEMFSWASGSLESDTYFCPERHGMYFGGFGLKTAPAMGKKDYAISTSLTGNSGEAFLAALGDNERRRIASLVDLQRQDLREIVSVRHAIATELRKLLAGQIADKAKVLNLSRRYGQLDGEMSYLYATAFADIGKKLTPAEKQALVKLRATDLSAPKGPFLYSEPLSLPREPDSDFLFDTHSSAASDAIGLR